MISAPHFISGIKVAHDNRTWIRNEGRRYVKGAIHPVYVMDLLASRILMDRDSVPEPNTLCGALSDGMVCFTMVTRPWESDPAGMW